MTLADFSISRNHCGLLKNMNCSSVLLGEIINTWRMSHELRIIKKIFRTLEVQISIIIQISPMTKLLSLAWNQNDLGIKIKRVLEP